MEKKKVIVTGGAGFIGSHLAAALRDAGLIVRVFDIRKPPAPLPGVQYMQGDVRRIEDLMRAFDGADIVFHLAALPRVQYSIENPIETFEVNAAGTLNVLHAAQQSGVKRVVYAASSSAYGDQDKMPLTEDMPASPKSPYGMQKYFGEIQAKVWSEVYGLPTVSLRYFNVYGPGASAEGAYALVIAKFLKQRLEGKPLTITGDGTQTRDFTHVRDVVRANLLAAESPKVGKGEVINIGAGNNTSVSSIAELIGGRVEYIPARLEPRDTLADISKAKELLGWEPAVTIEEGIAELKKLYGLS